MSGARPPYPRRPWLLRSLRSLPAPRRGAFCACAVRLRRATRVRSLRSPLRALAPGFASGSTRSPPPALALGGGVLGLSVPFPVARSLRAFRRSLRRWGVALFVRFLSVLGVCRVCFLFRFCSAAVFRGSFRPFPVRSVGGFCPGRVVPPVLSRLLALRGRRSLLVSHCCCVVLAVVGSPLVAGGFVLCRSPRPGLVAAVLVGFCSGCAAARSRWAWSRVARPRRRVRGSLRACFFPFSFFRLGGALWPLLCPLLLLRVWWRWVAFPWRVPGSPLCFPARAGSPALLAPGALSALRWPAAFRWRLALRLLAGLCCWRFPAFCRFRAGGLLVAASPALFPAAPLPALVGFSGGRRLSPVFRPQVAAVVAAVLASGRFVAVGCAAGADSFVRAATPGAVVFSASSFGSGRGAFAARSVALVRAVAAGGAGSGFVVFPAAPCPAGLVPSSSVSACFCGLGSGSWASAALAAGLQLPLVVFPCGFSILPPWGDWFPLSGDWRGGFLLR